LSAKRFADRAVELGLAFLEPIPQQIHAMSDTPKYPGASGSARLVSPDDAHLFADWMTAFTREATPHDPVPSRERLAKIAGESRHLFWTVDGEPVSMGGSYVERGTLPGSPRFTRRRSYVAAAMPVRSRPRWWSAPLRRANP
jgi:hypothetical protein